MAGWGDLLPGGIGDATPALLVKLINAADIFYDDDDSFTMQDDNEDD